MNFLKDLGNAFIYMFLGFITIVVIENVILNINSDFSPKAAGIIGTIIYLIAAYGFVTYRKKKKKKA